MKEKLNCLFNSQKDSWIQTMENNQEEEECWVPISVWRLIDELKELMLLNYGAGEDS